MLRVVYIAMARHGNCKGHKWLLECFAFVYEAGTTNDNVVLLWIKRLVCNYTNHLSLSLSSYVSAINLMYEIAIEATMNVDDCGECFSSVCLPVVHTTMEPDCKLLRKAKPASVKKTQSNETRTLAERKTTVAEKPNQISGYHTHTHTRIQCMQIPHHLHIVHSVIDERNDCGTSFGLALLSVLVVCKFQACTALADEDWRSTILQFCIAFCTPSHTELMSHIMSHAIISKVNDMRKLTFVRE